MYVTASVSSTTQGGQTVWFFLGPPWSAGANAVNARLGLHFRDFFINFNSAYFHQKLVAMNC